MVISPVICGAATATSCIGGAVLIHGRAQIRKNRFPAKSPVIGVKLTCSTTRSNRHAWRSALVRCGAVLASPRIVSRQLSPEGAA
jgi:hypothetical protein